MKPFIALDSCITSNRTLIWLAIPSEISKSDSACQIYYFYNFSTIVTKSSILSYYPQKPRTFIDCAHTVIGNRMMNRVKWKFFACFVPSVDDFVTKCYFDILFDFLMTKIIIEPKVVLVDVTMHPLWNFQSIICPQTKII